MSHLAAESKLPAAAWLSNQPPRIAVDLGAESCRVSLLQWIGNSPTIELVHRFRHTPTHKNNELRWDIDAILSGVEEGLRLAAEKSSEPIASIGVDGWAVDYVLLDAQGKHLTAPFCYRDTRNLAAEKSLHQRIAPHRLRELCAIQLQPLNTVYQHHADALGSGHGRWLNLPEYLLHRWGGRAVAERTNATHTGMVGLDGRWSEEILAAVGISLTDMPPIVEPGTDVGVYSGPIAALRNARLIAPCCHDTASAIAGIPDASSDWAYISSGTWSLVGTLLDAPCNTAQAIEENFTNLGAAGGRTLFHKGIAGMWLLQQCLAAWQTLQVTDLIAQAEQLSAFPPQECLNVDDPAFAQPGDMPARINAQRAAANLPEISDPARMTRLIFDSLAYRYADVLQKIAVITGKTFRRLYIVGGGSQNLLLNQLTEAATGIPVHRGAVESSTVGNLAVQVACANGPATAGYVARYAALFL